MGRIVQYRLLITTPNNAPRRFAWRGMRVQRATGHRAECSTEIHGGKTPIVTAEMAGTLGSMESVVNTRREW